MHRIPPLLALLLLTLALIACGASPPALETTPGETPPTAAPQPNRRNRSPRSQPLPRRRAILKRPPRTRPRPPSLRLNPRPERNAAAANTTSWTRPRSPDRFPRKNPPRECRPPPWPTPWRATEPGAARTAPKHQYRNPDLKAGEVDDNARWDEYLRYVADYQGPPIHGTSLDNRLIVRVRVEYGNGGSKPRLTYADGRSLFFPVPDLPDNPFGMTGDRGQYPEVVVTAERDGFTGTAELHPTRETTVTVEPEGRMAYGRVPLDILFLVDSTGSMADEIRRIKDTLQSIVQEISRLPSDPDLRLAMVSYRDRGDDYVTRLYDFDKDAGQFARTISRVEANGGGDYPELLNEALHLAVRGADWREDAVRLVFLIADAPPHLDYEQDPDYAEEMGRAREQGIKIFSVASSGLDERGEYVFRQIAQQTIGRFLFILYETGPQGRLDTPTRWSSSP